MTFLYAHVISLLFWRKKRVVLPLDYTKRKYVQENPERKERIYKRTPKGNKAYTRGPRRENKENRARPKTKLSPVTRVVSGINIQSLLQKNF
jgi:hypothetical protein